MQALSSWLKIIRIRKSNQRGSLTRLSPLDQKPFTPHNSRCQFTQKKYWQFTWHFSSLHTSCGKHQNRRLSYWTRNRSPVFSRQKLLRASNYVLKFNFKIAHIAGSLNTAADFLSRIELKVTEKICLKNRQDVQTTPVEVTKFSSGVADEEQFSFTQIYGEDETEERILQRKDQSQKTATECVAN